VAKLARKEDRRVKRRIRDIDGMIEIIKREIIEKGDMREGVTSIDLDQITANYKQNTQVVGSIGGMMIQIVFVVQAFFEAFSLPSDGEEAEK